MRRVGVLLLLFAAATARAQVRAGESIGGFPNWGERVIHEWINRARVDPQRELVSCTNCQDRGCYQPVAPLFWSEPLNRSARFHSDEEARQGYFSHDSRCTIVQNISQLYPVACDGAASCACVGGASSCAAGGCTTWNARVALFGGAPFGEIIAGTADPNTAFSLWINEASNAPLCGYAGDNGHRWLILTSTGSVGAGVGSVATADFGGGGAPYKIPSAAHYPRQAESVDLWANWYDAEAPRAANAVLDGHCISLTLARGTPRNGAWTAKVGSVGSGCHRYYFSFIDATGTEVTWPATGSLGIGCADWDSSRIEVSCDTPAPHSSRRRAARH